MKIIIKKESLIFLFAICFGIISALSVHLTIKFLNEDISHINEDNSKSSYLQVETEGKNNYIIPTRENPDTTGQVIHWIEYDPITKNPILYFLPTD